MKTIVKVLVAICAFLPLSFAMAYAPFSHIIAQEAPKVESSRIVTRGDISLIVSRYAFVYDVSEKTLNRVLECESTHNPNAVNINKFERSLGIAQINMLAHPEISEVQAYDPDFAIRYLASEVAKGHGGMWSCY